MAFEDIYALGEPTILTPTDRTLHPVNSSFEITVSEIEVASEEAFNVEVYEIQNRALDIQNGRIEE